jgi:putative hydrolase of the HAD superfamily
MPLALFDLDDTLIDREAAYHRWAIEFIAGLGVDDGGADAEVGWMVEVDDLGMTDRDAWAAAVAERYRLDGDPRQLRIGWHQAYLAHYRLEPPVADGLRQLRAAGWTLGIITNGPAGQEEKIRRNGLPGLVDGWAVSDLVGARKPSPAIFAAAADRCGGSLEGAWMVGDSAAADMAGGRAAGIGTIWLRRGRTWDQARRQPDPWAAQRGLPAESIDDGWEPDHAVDDVPAAVAILLG